MSDGYRNGSFALGLVTGVGIALNLILWLGYQDQRKADQHPDSNGDQGSEHVSNWFDGFIGTFVSPSDTLAQWIMAIFTIAVVVLVWKTLVATQEIASDTRRIGQAQVRAYLSFEVKGADVRAPSLSPDNADDPKPNIVVEIQGRVPNSGQSPASSISFLYQIDALPKGSEFSNCISQTG